MMPAQKTTVRGVRQTVTPSHASRTPHDFAQPSLTEGVTQVTLAGGVTRPLSKQGLREGQSVAEATP